MHHHDHHHPVNPSPAAGLWPREWARENYDPARTGASPSAAPAGPDPYAWYVTGGYDQGEFTPGPRAEDARGSYNRGRIGRHFTGHGTEFDHAQPDPSARGYAFTGSGSVLQGFHGGWGGEETDARRPANPSGRPLHARPPRNFRRSDHRLLDDVHHAILRTGVEAGGVEVACREGVVVLSGRVQRREDRFRLEHIAADVLGVRDVENHLKVGDVDQAHHTGLTGIAQAVTDGARAASGDEQQTAAADD